MTSLSDFEIELLRQLQNPLPICRHPFQELAATLKVSCSEVLSAIQSLKDRNIIRRFRAQLNYRALGRIASLVTAHVPNEKYDAVADAVSKLDGVSHNYCRDHHYNLWFTIQAHSLIGIDVTLNGLWEDYEVQFHSLPASRLFKLDVRFDPAGPRDFFGRSDRPGREIVVPDVPDRVELTESQKEMIGAIQTEMPIHEAPFDGLCGMDGDEGIDVLKSLETNGVLRKISAVLNYPELGYCANALFCAEIPSGQISEIGAALSSASMVSHCYERKTFDGWPFNLYGMCHAGTLEQIEAFTQAFCDEYGINHIQLLPTVKELKKEPVQIVL